MVETSTMTFPRTRQGLRDLDRVEGNFLPLSGGPAPPRRLSVNVDSNERVLSALAGGALVGFGLEWGSLPGLGLVLAGGSLLFRGLTGHCYAYQALGRNTARPRASNAEVVYRFR